jgi:hypothetical protein
MKPTINIFTQTRDEIISILPRLAKIKQTRTLKEDGSYVATGDILD